MYVKISAAALIVAACARSAAPPTAQRAPSFPGAVAAAITAHNASGVAAWFARDAEVQVIGGPALRGRAEIARGLDAVFARFADARVVLGRQWIRPGAAVVELICSATHGGKLIGVVAAAVVTFGDDGNVGAARLYIDVPTIAGQLDPGRLPEGARARPPISTPPVGTAVRISGGTAAEAANLAMATASWASLDANDAAGVVTAAAPDYVYEDFAGPAPLDLAGTRALLERWLALVPDFAIVAKPIHFAAGDDTVTELVERMTFRGRVVTLHGLAVKHFEFGHVAREWQYANGAESLAALFDITLEVF